MLPGFRDCNLNLDATSSEVLSEVYFEIRTKFIQRALENTREMTDELPFPHSIILENFYLSDQTRVQTRLTQGRCH